MNETAETAAQVSDQLYQAVLNRMNITWEPDEKTERNTKNAIEEALDYLRDTAGSPGLSFESGELRQLLITAAWYFVNNKRADFIEEYSGELNMLIAVDSNVKMLRQQQVRSALIHVELV